MEELFATLICAAHIGAVIFISWRVLRKTPTEKWIFVKERYPNGGRIVQILHYSSLDEKYHLTLSQFNGRWWYANTKEELNRYSRVIAYRELPDNIPPHILKRAEHERAV